MPIAIQKTLSLLLMILLGYLLRSKLNQDEHRKGMKVVILDLALPAMIFVALMGVQLESDLLLLPLMVLCWNGIMLATSYFVLPWMGIERLSPQHRTWMMLFPSLAPGLSCFPFLIEYLGEEALAWGALADVGNKVYVLLLAYMIAMAWYYRVQKIGGQSSNSKIKELLLAMVKEPINMVLIVAIVLLSLGLNMDSLPGFMGETILMMKNIMTPLVLLFIGMSVILKWKQIQSIFSLLLFRAGVSLMISGLILYFFELPSSAAALVLVVFPLSSASFWPFAHMSSVHQLEYQKESTSHTFDLGLGINILAVSLPFSTLLILGIFSAGEVFVAAKPVVLLGLGLFVLPLIPKMVVWAKNLDFDFSLPKNPTYKDSTSQERG